MWLESAEAIFGPYPRFREVRPQAQAAALLPLSTTGRRWARSGSSSTSRGASRADDRDYLLALTRLCGQALGRARRYQAEHDLAATLQQALLPESLPRADGLELAVRYLPAADGTAAGGDFYDAVELPGGRLGIAVGDIVGHGPAAAAAMGQLRSALRAYALEGRPPARVMQLLSATPTASRARAARRSPTPCSTPARARSATRARDIRRRCWCGRTARRGSWRARAASRWTARSGTSTTTRPRRCPRARR